MGDLRLTPSEILANSIPANKFCGRSGDDMFREGKSLIRSVTGVLMLVSLAWIQAPAQTLTTRFSFEAPEPYSPIVNEEAQGCVQGHEVDSIVAEYVNAGLEQPQCNDLKNSGGSRHFSFEQFLQTDRRTPMGHEHNWAWLRQTMLDGIDHTYEHYQSEMSLRSGYRCPTKNEAVKGARKSRHVFGDAVDVEATPAQQLVILENTTAVFFLQYRTHVHLDWRPMR